MSVETKARKRHPWRAWSEDDVRALKALAKQKKSDAQIGRALKRSRKAIRQRASIMGLSLSVRLKWSEEAVGLLKRLAFEKKDAESIARILERSTLAIRQKASLLGVSLDTRRNRSS
jgi:hypothetical protein